MVLEFRGLGGDDGRISSVGSSAGRRIWGRRARRARDLVKGASFTGRFMSTYTASIRWTRDPGTDFAKGQYSRACKGV